MNKKAVSPVIAVMLLIAVAVAAVGAYFIWYQSFKAGSQRDVEDTVGLIGSKLRITNIVNDNDTFYVTLKNSTGEDLNSTNVTIEIKDSKGIFQEIRSVLVSGKGLWISDDDEGQFEVELYEKTIPGETYTIVFTAVGVTTVEKYTAI